MNTEQLKILISTSDDILMDKILHYAKEHNYARYTSTLKEAWRLSISGLSAALMKVLDMNNEIPAIVPDIDFMTCDISEFGILEARKHRSRGITLSMFLSFMKYYYQAYIDVINESHLSLQEIKESCEYIKKYFDYVELGFTVEWVGLTETKALEDLQEANRLITNEKNMFLTIFESIYDPIIVLDKLNRIENMNSRAAEVFFDVNIPGKNYYSSLEKDSIWNWLEPDVIDLTNSIIDEISREQTVSTKMGMRTFAIKFKKMLDVSEKFKGTVIIFNDITERIRIENELTNQKVKLEEYAFTDPMTGVANRRTGLMILEKEIAVISRYHASFTICYIDIDNLKVVNDELGHLEGDTLICNIANSIKETIRAVDTVCRIGGDEFLIVFPNCTEVEAEGCMARIINNIEKINIASNYQYKHSFSYGLLEITRESRPSALDAINEVDKRMYYNKALKKSAYAHHDILDI